MEVEKIVSCERIKSTINPPPLYRSVYESKAKGAKSARKMYGGVKKTSHKEH